MGGDSINESGLLMCSGCILCNTSIYTDFPACIGWSGKFKVLCLEGAFCLKLGTPTMKCICCDLSISKGARRARTRSVEHISAARDRHVPRAPVSQSCAAPRRAPRDTCACRVR